MGTIGVKMFSPRWQNLMQKIGKRNTLETNEILMRTRKKSQKNNSIIYKT